MNTITNQSQYPYNGSLSEQIEWAKANYGTQDVDWTIIYDARGAGGICRDPNHPTLRSARAKHTGQITFEEVLATIDAHETLLRHRTIAALPAEPKVPELIEEPSAIVVTATAFGGKWVRRKYADGTLSKAAWMGKGLASPRYLNADEVQKARIELQKWREDFSRAIGKIGLIGGHVRGLLNGTDRRSGGYRDFGPRTLEQLRTKAQGNSHTAAYCAEAVRAYDRAKMEES